MKNIDDLLNENPYLFGAVMILIESAKENQDFKALYKWDSLRDEDFKRNSMKYFIDYSEDSVLPCVGNSVLVEQYAILMSDKLTDIEVFETREEMLEAVADIASYARDGVSGEQIFTDEELLKKIGKFSKDLPII